jgi:hypothetical protein
MPIYSFRSYGSRGSGLGNPCPSGFKANTLIIETFLSDSTLKNVTFLTCDEKEGGIDLGLALGLGLGLGIPVLLLLSCLIWRVYKNCKADNEWRRRIENQYYIGGQPNQIQPEDITPEKEVIFNKLGYRLHRDFLAGNLTDELKVSLINYKVNDLLILENYAREHNKNKIALHIRTIIDSKELPNATAPFYISNV